MSANELFRRLMDFIAKEGIPGLFSTEEKNPFAFSLVT